MRFYKKYQLEQMWLQQKSWSFPDSQLHPNNDSVRRHRRLPLSEELKKLRREHMIGLHKEGASYALIGRLYKLDRKQVQNIINN